MKTEKKRLYLDDVRTPLANDWIVVRNYDEFVAQVKLNGLDKFEVISLDHDLGEGAMVEYYTNVKNNYVLDYNNINERTGYDVAKFLVAESMRTNIPLPTIYVHSANPVGSGNIFGYITNYFKNCKVPGTCMVNVTIPHTINEQLKMSPEARKARWDRSKEK
jgi:hypothetical protein